MRRRDFIKGAMMLAVSPALPMPTFSEKVPFKPNPVQQELLSERYGKPPYFLDPTFKHCLELSASTERRKALEVLRVANGH